MILLNFSHPLTPNQQHAIAQMVIVPYDKMVTIPCHLDIDQLFAEQVVAIVDSAKLTAKEWQGEQLLVNLPALSTAAVLVLVELHGRCGYYPPCIRLKREADSMLPVYVLAEILDVDAQRQLARSKR